MTKLFPDIATAAKAGYATFNEGPHLAVDVPAEGNLTITARTSTGKLVTFCFVGGAGCVDLMYHNSDLPEVHGSFSTADTARPFHMVGFTKGGTAFDTRKTQPTTLATILL